MSEDIDDRPSRLYPADAAILSALLGRFGDLVHRLEADSLLRGRLFAEGDAFRFPVASPRIGDGGFWLEERVVPEAAVVGDALDAWVRS
jgi:hypothetical protein